MPMTKNERDPNPGRRLWKWGLVMAMLASGAGCQSGGGGLTAPSPSYRTALAATTPPVRFARDGEEERAALGRVKAFFGDFSESNVTALVREVYAPDAYLRDGFKELRGIDAIAPYMIRSTEPLRMCVFDFEAITVDDGEYYLRWVMRVNLKRDRPDRVEQAIGLTHMRFDAQGRILFQQDYWDPSDVLYDRIPIAGWLIRKVKASL